MSEPVTKQDLLSAVGEIKTHVDERLGRVETGLKTYVDERSERVETNLLSAVADLKIYVDERLEIGRASCRERV